MMAGARVRVGGLKRVRTNRRKGWRQAGRDGAKTRAERVSLASNPMLQDDKGGNIALRSAGGTYAKAKDLFEGQRTVLCLLRELRERKPELDALGLRLVAVMPNDQPKVAEFARDQSFPEECLFADEERKVYAAMSTREGAAATFLSLSTPLALLNKYSVKDAKDLIKSYSFKQPSSVEETLQQGGTFAFDSDRVLYAYRDGGTADHAPLDDVLNACRSA